MEKEVRPRLTGGRLMSYLHLTRDENRVLVIGDLHEPFTLKGYLEFCLETYNNYNCDQVVFIGDIVDNHYSSFHESDPDGLGGGDELDLSVSKLKRWHDAFPNATVILGNHDIMVARKAQSTNIPKKWIRSYREVLEVPTWNFVEELVIDDVMYVHGIGSKAHIRAQKNMMSTVQGHHHTDCYSLWHVGKRDKVFGMQVGCGIDINSYAMAYAKWFPKPAIGCGVVLGGHTPINVLMNL